MTKLEELKQIGEAPDYLTEDAYATMSSGYLQLDETPLGLYKRVSHASAMRLNMYHMESKFLEILWKGWLGLASPVASNMGGNNLPISCFSSSVADDTYQIFEHYKELAILSKYGGGTGSFWGNVRGRGTPISKGGVSEGVVPWLNTLEKTITAVSQAGVRKGAVAAYLPVGHKDIVEFLDIRKNTGDISRKNLSNSFHHGVTIDDNFMNAVKSGDKKARSLWSHMLKNRTEFGENYMIFIDSVNKANPKMYKDRGLKVETSNLCLSGDTLVITCEMGSKPIRELVGKTVTIFDGKHWVINSGFKQTQASAEMYRVHFSDGSHVDATKDHRWFAKPANKRESEVKHYSETKTDSLQPGMKLEYHLEGTEERPFFNQVEKIEKLEGNHEAYCTSVPSTTKFALANGLMTGNCSEITLFTDESHTFVCCLSSMNLAKYDEWKDTDAVQVATFFLDGVMQEFIDKAKHIQGFEKAVRFAEKSRALGLGVIGWHTLLQKRNIPFDSFQSMQLNAEVFRHLDSETLKATQKLAQELGEPEWCKGYGVRNTHRIAIAPTTTNALLAGGVSQGIEPLNANLFSQKMSKGVIFRKNPVLKDFLGSLGKDTPEVWAQIDADRGSVKNLKFLSDYDKDVFKTAREINQFSLVRQAGQRQRWIDQSSSLNLFFGMPNDVTDEKEKNLLARYIHQVHMEAYDLGVKSLYYLRTESVLKGDPVFQDSSDCKACEG